MLTWTDELSVSYACGSSLYTATLMYDNRSCRHTLQKDAHALPPGSSIIRSYACAGVSPNRLYVYFGTTAGELVVLRTDTKVSICYTYLYIYMI